MRLRHSSWFLFSLLASAAGCDEPPEQRQRAGFGDADISEVTGEPSDMLQDDASVPTDGPDAADPAPPRPSYAVVSGDYVSTSISLLDQYGELLEGGEDYINSGYTEAGLTTALSGDVGLPTRSGDKGKLILLDRFKTDVITRLDLASGEILGQVRTHRRPPAGSTSQYSSNPQDYVYFDETTAWVTRYEPNLDTGIPEVDRGTDLIRVNPREMTLSLDHIDLWQLNTTASRTNPDTQQLEEVPIYARPSGMVRVGDVLVVGLSRQAFDFTANGTGMVALVDVTDGHVEPLAIDGLENCSNVLPVSGAEDHVLVDCLGDYNGDRRATSGIVMLHVTGSTAELTHAFVPGDDQSMPVAVDAVVSLGGTRVGAVAVGGEDTPDVYYVVDLESGESRELFRATGAYKIGGGSYDALQKLLLVPDGSTDEGGRASAGLRRFSLANDTIEERDMLRITPALGLSVHSVSAL